MATHGAHLETPGPTDGGVDRRAVQRALFDAISADYDRVGVEFFGPIAAGLLEHLAPTPGERFLDVGCGSGALLLPAAGAVTSAGRAVGLDSSAGMLERSRSALAAAGISHGDLVLGDAQELPPLSGGPFDAVGSSLVLFFLPDPVAALRGWQALLRPGGRLGISTFGPQDAAWDHLDDVFTAFLPADMLDARTSGRRGPFGSDAGVEGLLTAAGLTGVHTRTWDLRLQFADAAQWHAWTMSTGQRAMWARIPADQRAEVRAEAERRLHAARAADGSITVGQQVRYTIGHRPN